MSTNLVKVDVLIGPCFRFPEKIGGSLPGVHYIRDVADANSLISSLVIFNSFYFDFDLVLITHSCM